MLVFLIFVLCTLLLCLLKSKHFKPSIREPIHAVNFIIDPDSALADKAKLSKTLPLPNFDDPMEFPRENITFLDTVLGKSPCSRSEVPALDMGKERAWSHH